MSRSGVLPPQAKRALVTGTALVMVGCAFAGLVTSPITSSEWFASLALFALFLPLLVISASQFPAIGRRLGGPVDPSDLRVAAVLFGCLTLTFVAGGVSGAIGYLVNGMTGFWTSAGPRRWISMPFFLGSCAVGAVVFGLLTTLSAGAVRHRPSHDR